jgi:alkylation response protein AidB-like acyl-CoA dehydrogenase
MDFATTPEQAMLQDSVRRTLADLGERSGSRMRGALADLGVFAVPLPAEMGGLGGSPADTMLVMKEFGKALVEDAFLPAALFSGALLARLGLETDLVENMATGEALTVLATIEASGRGDAGFVRTRACREDDRYVLNGRKSVVLGADEARAFLVTARPEDGAFPGIGLFRIPVEAVAAPAAYRTIDGFKAADLVLDEVSLPLSSLIAANCGEALAQAADFAIVAACAEMVGAMEAGFWITNEYLKTRRQFGVVIGTFQALQHRLADRYVDLEQAQSMLYRAIAALEGTGTDRRRTVAAAKAYIGRIGRQFGADMIQLHGGIGVTEEHVIGHYYRRLLALDGRYGDCDHHLARFAEI